MNRVLQGNSLEVLKTLAENSVDSIVTDPPYGLSFMGKKWDYDVPSTELWKEAIRVLKPGGHLLSFAGSRTYHRMAVNIEDAGFEIRDQIMWVYGSGFPKSHNIGKAVDKIQGNEREVVGTKRAGIADSPFSSVEESRKHIDDTKGTSPYEGWGTALKPAHEPIVVARKPLSESTIAENVLKWGTGGINIDGSRIPTTDKTGREVYQTQSWKNTSTAGVGSVNDDWKQGRFPANFIHDGSDEVVGLFPDTKGGGSQRGSRKWKGEDGQGGFGGWAGKVSTDNYISRDDGTGSASRFFYCAKASKKDRNEGLEGFEIKQTWASQDKREANSFDVFESDGRPKTVNANNHPTVKPTSLMQYLVRLVTPKGGTVLDPFMGSGSTGKACVLEGFDFIGIELDPEYCKIAEARISFVV